MGFLDRIRSTLGLEARSATLGALASPWAERPTHLEPVAMTEWVPTTHRPPVIDRERAIRVPALARARGLICSTIARLPILAEHEDGTPATPPAFLTDRTGVLSPFHRMLWTIDDLFFYGWSLWACERDTRGEVVACERVAYHRWGLDSDDVVLVDGEPAPADAVILIPGVTEGILIHGADTLDQARRLDQAAARAAENPSAQIELHQTNDAPLSRDDIEYLKKTWMAARRGENGGVAVTTSGIEVNEHGAAGEHLLLEGRNASAIDIARHCGIPATMIDATLTGSSLSYQNAASRMSELVTFGLAPFMGAVASRLSQHDVTPDGISLVFDTKTMLKELAELYKTEQRERQRDTPVIEEGDE